MIDDGFVFATFCYSVSHEILYSLAYFALVVVVAAAYVVAVVVAVAVVVDKACVVAWIWFTE